VQGVNKQETAPATTTRAAILGQLALGDWSAYELTRSMRRTLRFFWPRAEKRLQDQGLARARDIDTGSRRNRTVYSITAAGRAALARWLREEVSPPVAYLEPMLRIHLARFGDRADLIRAIDALASAADDILATADDVAQEFSTGSHIFQDEAHLRGLLFDALVSQATAWQEWSERARKEVRRWPDLHGDAAARRRAVGRMRAHLRARQSNAS
jgi:PadR family transcriptional regulator AphA